MAAYMGGGAPGAPESSGSRHRGSYVSMSSLTDATASMSPAVSSGDLAYTEDDGQLCVFDGSSWVAAGGVSSMLYRGARVYSTYAELPDPTTLTAGEFAVVVSDLNPALNGEYIVIGISGSLGTAWSPVA